MIEIDPSSTDGKSSNVWISFIKTPTGQNLHYQGSPIPMNPGDVEHPDRYRLLYRNKIQQPL
jgi:hypothetical protein